MSIICFHLFVQLVRLFQVLPFSLIYPLVIQHDIAMEHGRFVNDFAFNKWWLPIAVPHDLPGDVVPRPCHVAGRPMWRGADECHERHDGFEQGGH